MVKFVEPFVDFTIEVYGRC